MAGTVYVALCAIFLVPTLLRNVPGSASYFVVLEFFQGNTRIIARSIQPSVAKFLVDEEGKLSGVARFSCSAFSRSLVGFSFMPISVIKTRLEVKFPGFFQSAEFISESLIRSCKHLFHQRGIRGSTK